jgi:hypothetical protein
MPPTIKRRFAPTLDNVVLAAVLAAWAAACLAILSHRIFVTNDSLSDYVHVWYVADVFWHGGGIPLHFPEIGHGDALAFPYAFLPWFSAALLRPLLGDWVVTLWLVLGGIGVTAAAAWAFPELRKPLPLALFLVNPFMVEAVLLGQLPFLWATAPWFVAVGCWRRNRTALAVLFAAVAQAGHPAVLLPLAGLNVLVWLYFERQRKRLFIAYCVSVALAAPAIVLVLISPVVEDSSTVSLLANFVGTVSIRAAVVYAPYGIILLAKRLSARRLAALVAIVAALNLVLVPIRDTSFAWQALARTPDTSLNRLFASPEFRRGATYRILRVADGKVGMYQLLQHGARLDSELFPESIDRRSWDYVSLYQRFLASRNVNFVLIYHAYDERYHTNEHALLDELVARGCATRTYQEPGFDLYSINPACFRLTTVGS